uniref:Cadherin domain-containing protein n=1 Tax=Heterorhabditis bacteriophora TaxID=37862 RepID=A0A1I7WFC0_HETBA
MVTVRVTDVNDNSPRFSVTDISVIIKDGMNSGDFIQRITASDEDFGENGRVSYRILSGNDFDLLSLNADSGALVFNEWNDEQLLKYESGMWTMMVEARDNGIKRRSSLLPVKVFINLVSWSGTAPFFVMPNYVIPVLESSAHGSVVFVAHATNRLGMMMKGLSYRLKNSDEVVSYDIVLVFFSINPSTGTVTLVRPLDYETRTSHKMSLSASDKNGRSAVLPLEFIILPADEYPPVFTESSYSFQIPVDAEVGSVIGTVQAVDADGGQHGVVTYRIDGEFPLIAVNRISGQVTLRHPIHRGSNFTIEQFTLIAESSLTQQSRTTVHLEVYSVRKGQTAVISDMSRMSPSYSKDKLTSLPSNVAQKTTSITSSVSTSSGLRHSVLSNRDFISTRSQPDSGIDPDTVSLNSSVTDYLVSIGVNPNPIPQRIKHGENGYMTGSQLKKKRVERMDSSFSEMIYARLEDIITPGPLNMSQNLESLEPSTNLYVPQRNLPPTFQPLTEILNEIAEMQRQEKAKREYVQVEI